MMFKKVLLGLLAICLIFSVISCKQNVDIGTNAKTPTWLIGKWLNSSQNSCGINFSDTELTITVPKTNVPIRIPYNNPGVTTKVENNKFILIINKDSFSSSEIAVLEQLNLSDKWTYEKEGDNLKVNMVDSPCSYIKDSSGTGTGGGSDSGANAQTPDWLIGSWVDEVTRSIEYIVSKTSIVNKSGQGISFNEPGIKTKVENNKFIIEHSNNDGLVTGTYTFEKDGDKMIMSYQSNPTTFVKPGYIGSNEKTPDWLIGKWIDDDTGDTLHFYNFTETAFLDHLGNGLHYYLPGIKTKVENNKFIIDCTNLEGSYTKNYTFEKNGEKMIMSSDGYLVTFTRATT